jgi:hypothetical protein
MQMVPSCKFASEGPNICTRRIFIVIEDIDAPLACLLTYILHDVDVKQDGAVSKRKENSDAIRILSSQR